MARFIGATIESVIGQDYPNIEYIIMDGGSTDGTLDVIRRYEHLTLPNVAFRWFSGPDAGTADAINKGFARAQGPWSNTLMPTILIRAARSDQPCKHLWRTPRLRRCMEKPIGWRGWRRAGRYPTKVFDPALLPMECFICQPASFIRREALSLVGALDASLHDAYDYEFWMRLARGHSLVKLIRYWQPPGCILEQDFLGPPRGVRRRISPCSNATMGTLPLSISSRIRRISSMEGIKSFVSFLPLENTS